MKLVDAVVQLHDIARLVENEVGSGGAGALGNRIRKIADDLHVYSIDDDRANEATKEIITKAKE